MMVEGSGENFGDGIFYVEQISLFNFIIERLWYRI